MLFELVADAAVLGPVAGVVDARRDLVDQQDVVAARNRNIEKLDPQDPDIVQPVQDGFGDGAGAVVLGSEESADGARGILASKLHADGRHNQLLYVDGGPSTTQTVGKLRMRGQEVFRHAVVNLASVLNEVMAMAGLTNADIDWLVPHQANARILDATTRKLKLSPDRVVVTVDRHANTSAASVPLALDLAVRDGRIKPGELIVLEAMGGGFTWGACVIRL